MINVRKVFRANCGDGARYLDSSTSDRGGHKVLLLNFEMVPEGRKFNLDSVIYPPCRDEQIEAAVLRVADIAKNIRDHIKPDVPARRMNGH